MDRRPLLVGSAIRTAKAARTRSRARAVLCLLLAAFVCKTTAFAFEQAMDISKVKAAFLYNFAKFTEWPADRLAPGSEIAMCVIGDYPVADALEFTIKGRSVEGHTLSVQVVKADGPLRSCHVLFVGATDLKRVSQILETIRGASVLSVSDTPTFATIGGVAELILENDRLRFAVNIAAMQQGRLQMSSKLLSLAMIVKGP